MFQPIQGGTSAIVSLCKGILVLRRDNYISCVRRRPGYLKHKPIDDCLDIVELTPEEGGVGTI